MPELTTAHNEHSAVMQCFLQFAGMSLGVCIMLLIALFEEDIQSIFSSSSSSSSDPHHYHHHDH